MFVTIFSQGKCFICRFSSGMYREAIIYSIQKSDHGSNWTFISPLLAEVDMSYVSHYFYGFAALL